jgi:hypothetical protein
MTIKKKYIAGAGGQSTEGNAFSKLRDDFGKFLENISNYVFKGSDAPKTFPIHQTITEIEYTNKMNSDGTRIGQTAVYEKKTNENVFSSAINSAENFLARLVGSAGIVFETDETKTNLNYEDMFKTDILKGPENWFVKESIKKGGKKTRGEIKKNRTRKTKHYR